jgi:hypothetical protein
MHVTIGRNLEHILSIQCIQATKVIITMHLLFEVSSVEKSIQMKN